ncbi:MAG: ABC transporter substrate-binding protein [Burkholderiales bacterium]
MNHFKAWAKTGLLLFLLLAATPSIAEKVVYNAMREAESDLDCVVREDRYSNVICEPIFEPLLTYDYLARPAKVVPNTAVSMPEITDGGTTYMFKIRPGIYFHPDPAFKNQKRELTAADYVFTFKRFYDPVVKSAWNWIFDGKIVGEDEAKAAAEKTGKFDYDLPWEGFKAIDRYTLRVKLKQPDYNFNYFMAMVNTGAQAREVVEFYGLNIAQHPIGTGPFYLKSWVPKSKIVLQKFSDYRETYFDGEPGDDPWDQEVVKALKGKRLPVVDRVEVSMIPESQPRLLAFLNNEHDYMEEVDFEFINQVAPGGKPSPALAKKGISIFPEVQPEITYTWFNMEDPVVGGYKPENIALRRAMILGYNINEEIQVIRKGQVIAAQSPIPPGVTGYDKNYRSPTAEYNPPKAKALLDLYGYLDRDGDGYRERPDGSPLSLVITSPPTNEYRPQDELWRKSMDALGIRVSFNKATFSEQLKAARLGQLQMRLSAWIADYPDADNFLQLLYGPNSGQSNESRFNLPEFNRMYLQAQRMPDSPERTRLYQEMARLVSVYAPWKLGVHRKYTHLIHPWVLGYKKHPIMLEPWKFIDIDVEKQKAARE